jgi:hypothetical protein
MGRLSGKNARADWVTTAVRSGLLPPYPGATVVPPVIVPPPPLLGHDMSDIDVAETLAEAYRASVYAVMGEVSRAMTRSRIEDTRWFHSLCACGRLLRDASVAPLSWAVWSMEVWKGWKPGGRPGPPNWVFSPTRVDGRMDNFLREFGSVGQPRMVITDAHRELLARYRAVVDGVAAEGVGALRALLAEHLPVGMYDELLSRASEESALERGKIEMALTDGAWLWGSTK